MSSMKHAAPWINSSVCCDGDGSCDGDGRGDGDGCCDADGSCDGDGSCLSSGDSLGATMPSSPIVKGLCEEEASPITPRIDSPNTEPLETHHDRKSS